MSARRRTRWLRPEELTYWSPSPVGAPLFPNHGMTAGVRRMGSMYPGFFARNRRSIIGTLMNVNNAVMTRGPTIVHQKPGSAATPKSQRPHQKEISPK